MNGPSHKPGAVSRGIKSSGVAGVKAVDGYRLMLFSFGIEAINSSSQRIALMKEIANFMQPDSASELQNLASAASRRIPAGQSSERVILERADLLSSVEDRLLNQIKEEFSKNPQSRDRVLSEIRSLPSQERRALNRLEKNIQSLLDFSEEHGTLRQR
jgi:hypothetical protein